MYFDCTYAAPIAMVCRTWVVDPATPVVPLYGIVVVRLAFALNPVSVFCVTSITMPRAELSSLWQNMQGMELNGVGNVIVASPFALVVADPTCISSFLSLASLHIARRLFEPKVKSLLVHYDEHDS